MAVLGLRFCARAFSSCGERGPLFIAVRGPLTIVVSLIAEHRLQTRRLSSCGSRAQLLRCMWDPPRPGLEPVSPALAGRLSTTAPPGKPNTVFFDRHKSLKYPPAQKTTFFLFLNRCKNKSEKLRELPQIAIPIIYSPIASHFKMQWLKTRVYYYFSWLCVLAEVAVTRQVGLWPPEGPLGWPSRGRTPVAVSWELAWALTRALTCLSSSLEAGFLDGDSKSEPA